MADVGLLKRMYRRWAALVKPDSLAEQKAWLEEKFVARMTGADDGGFEATSTGFEGGSMSGIINGSSAEARASALDLAIEEITKEMAEETDVTGVAVLMPRVCGVPR
jgi:hypothetical protein